MTDQATRYNPGKIYITPFAHEQIPHDDLVEGLERHVCGEWGDHGGHDSVLPTSAFGEGKLVISKQTYHPRAPKILLRQGIEDWDPPKEEYLVITNECSTSHETYVLLSLDMGNLTLLPLSIDL